MNNRSKAMYSSLAGLVVVGAIALATALGHHSAPPTSFNLSSPPPAAQQGLSKSPATSSGPAPGTSYATTGGATVYPGNGADAGPVSWTCNVTDANDYQVVLTDPAASGPVKVTTITVQIWSPEGALLDTETPAFSLSVFPNGPATLNLATTTAVDSQGSCSVDSLTEIGTAS